MGRTVYSPIHEWLISMVNVGIYTSPVDPMGIIGIIGVKTNGHHSWFLNHPSEK